MIRRFFYRVFRNWWVVTITLVVIACLILSVGLPLLFASMKPMWIRLSLSGAVIFMASAASARASWFFHRIAAQPSGEMTE